MCWLVLAGFLFLLLSILYAPQIMVSFCFCFVSFVLFYFKKERKMPLAIGRQVHGHWSLAAVQGNLLSYVLLSLFIKQR